VRYQAALHPEVAGDILAHLALMVNRTPLCLDRASVDMLRFSVERGFCIMALRQMRYLSDNVLRGKAKKVSTIDQSIQRLIDDMIETMQQSGGVGLAAPQVGVPLRVIVLQMPEKEPLAIINPEIVKRSGEREIMEGCLSFPGYQGEIKRSISVSVKGLDRQGKAIRIKATGLMAQALEHEIDHLNGILYIEHLESEDKLYKLEPKNIHGKHNETSA
jgi:peptide deformylase